jgi:hypothetical protein
VKTLFGLLVAGTLVMMTFLATTARAQTTQSSVAVYEVRLDGEPFPWQSCGKPLIETTDLDGSLVPLGWYWITFKSVMGETVRLPIRTFRIWREPNHHTPGDKMYNRILVHECESRPSSPLLKPAKGEAEEQYVQRCTEDLVGRKVLAGVPAVTKDERQKCMDNWNSQLRPIQ